MPVKRVNLRDFAEELGKWSEKHIEDLKAGARRGIFRSFPGLIEASPVDTGLYAASWDFTETEDKMILGNLAPHAPIIEIGARPFRPPLRPLLAWAKRVLRDPSQPPNYSPQVWRLAVGTQKKIEQVGMGPRHVMRNQIPNILENIRKEWQKIG